MASAAEVKLYYFPTSYYSQKALLALYEKDVAFKEQVVNIMTGEQNQDWYLAVNDNGEVPVLEIDGKCIAQSETIIDVIDKTFTSGPNLVPDVETKYGNDVNDFRKLLHDIPIDVITYGIICNRHLKHEDGVIGAPSFATREQTALRFNGTLNVLQTALNTSPPDIREAIERKVQKITIFLANVMDENKVSTVLDDLEGTFDKIEEKLKKSKEENGGREDTWLFGSSFTAADIGAFTLMFRLQFVGLDTRYFSSKKRPILLEYFTRLKQRPAVVKLMAKFDTAKSIFAKMMMKSFGIRLLKLGLVVGLIGIGYVGLREVYKKASLRKS